MSACVCFDSDSVYEKVKVTSQGPACGPFIGVEWMIIDGKITV